MRKLLAGLSVVWGLVGANTASADMCSGDPNNLVQNCGLETGNLTGWSSSGQAGVNQLSYQGTYAAYLQAGGNIGADASIYPDMPIIPK